LGKKHRNDEHWPTTKLEKKAFLADAFKVSKPRKEGKKVSRKKPPPPPPGGALRSDTPYANVSEGEIIWEKEGSARGLGDR